LEREPHEPTLQRNGAELWVTGTPAKSIAIIDVAAHEARTTEPSEKHSGIFEYNQRRRRSGFSKDGKLAFVASQKVSQIDLFETNFNGSAIAAKAPQDP